jgi:hypothetical protein
MQFQPYESGIEVSGQSIKLVIDSLGLSKTSSDQYLMNSELPETINAQEWYPQEKWLNVLKDIALTLGDNVLFDLGYNIPANVKFPPFVNDIHLAIESIDIAFHLNHKKAGMVMFQEKAGEMTEGIGHYGYRKIEGENLIVSECANPYPDYFDLGILTCMAKKFKPNASVMHDDSKPCRKNGAESCTYIISW